MITPAGTPPSMKGAAFRGVPSFLFWTSSLVVALLSYTANIVTAGQCAVAVAALGLLHSGAGFWRHGGTRISAPAVFLLGMGLFGYFPTLYYAFVGEPVALPYEIRGLSAMLVIQVALYGVWITSNHRSTGHSRQAAARSPCVIGALAGASSLAGGLLIGALGVEGLQHLTQPFGYAGAVLTALSLVQAGARVNARVLVLVGGLFAGFVVFLFSGGGRLVLGSLAVALTMCVGLRWRPSFLKPLVLASLAPGLWVLARIRSERTSNQLTGYEETGLESVVWPQRLFFDVIASVNQGSISLGQGETFAAAAVAWVPRESWENKPVGFGTKLTELYRPELLAVGHSEAALVHGEFMYNFGWSGLALMTLILGVGIARLDRWLRASDRLRVSTVNHLLGQAAAVVLTAGLLDLVWVGTFTYVTRAGFACAALAMLWVVVRLLRLDEFTGRSLMIVGDGSSVAHPRQKRSQQGSTRAARSRRSPPSPRREVSS